MGGWRVESHRSSATPVGRVAWNPEKDVLALIGRNGEIVAQRMFWKRAWRSATIGSDVGAAVWSPDGEVLASAHADGRLRLLSLQSGALMASSTLPHQRPVAMSWFPATAPALRSPPPTHQYEGRLARGKSLSSWLRKVTQDPEIRSVLCVAYENSRVTILLNGILPFAEISLPTGTLISSIAVEPDLSTMVIAGTHEKSFTLNRSDLRGALGSPLIWALTQEQAGLLLQLEYLEEVLGSLKESWEGLLLELDEKLSALAKEASLAGGGSVGEDLLSLLVLGTASDSLVQFLLHTLSESGLAKIAAGVRKSEERTSQLVSASLVPTLSGLLGRLVGLRRGVQGLGAASSAWPLLRETEKAAGALLLKAAELEAGLGRCGADVRLFLAWLHKAQLILLEKEVPPELEASVGSKESISHLVRFLRETFMRPWSAAAVRSGPLFRLETVGQYLQPGPLAHTNTPFLRQHFTHQLLQGQKEGGRMEFGVDGSFSTPMEDDAALDPPYDPVAETLYKPNPSASLVDLVEEVKMRLEYALAAVRDANSEHCALRPTEMLGPVSDKSDKALVRLDGDSATCIFPESDSTLACVRASELLSSGPPSLRRASQSWAHLGLGLVDFGFFEDDSFVALLRGDGGVFLGEGGGCAGSGEGAAESLEGGGDAASLWLNPSRGLAAILSASATRILLLNAHPEGLDETRDSSSTSRLSSQLFTTPPHAAHRILATNS